jgi:hypothetical protein
MPGDFTRLESRVRQGVEGTSARARDHHVPDRLVGLITRQIGESAAAKARHQPGPDQGGLAGAAVTHDYQERLASQLFDQLLRLALAAEEQLGLLLVECPKTREGLLH